MDASAFAAQADQAAAEGKLHEAERFLLQAVEASPGEIVLLLKLAGLQRAKGEAEAALRTVERALAIEPRDFTALLLRASLLDRAGAGGAAVAWSHALAQRPPGAVPPHLASVVAQAERRVEEWTAAREKVMVSATSAAEAAADEDERKRIERFRSNRLRKTRHYHSEPTDFHYPGLRELEFHPRGRFPWIERAEAQTKALTEELHRVMSAERAELVPYVHYDDHLPMEQWRPLNRSLDWTAIHLIKNGVTVEANARHCPRTMELLAALPQPKISGSGPNAMFSLLAPNTQIPPHVGVNNARLVCHLPLVVPEGCWFRVGAETRAWNVGEAFVFDDTIEHEAMNPTDELRVVFIFDVWHYDLSETEREAVAALIGTETGGGGGL
ncbi:MAG TPA: aspartyl/asparaginyl beta-hydroxylase domain-containing protein [Sphingomicrobium sp.]|nr:aspartyl/asparaginyl beta-hydroxylase domain-containing protein [Sphingomicrobium sp.]